MFPIVLALHVLGVALWIGAALSAARLILLQLEQPGSAPPAALESLFVLARRGMEAAIATGLIAALMRGSYYFHQKWFLAKLALSVLAVGLHVGLKIKSRRLASGAPVEPGAIRGLSAGLFAASAAVLLLVFTQPF